MISKGWLRSYRRHCVYFVPLTKVKSNQCFCGITKKQKYLYSLVYDSGNKTAPMGFELTLGKKKTLRLLDYRLMTWPSEDKHIFLKKKLCVRNLSPAARLVRFFQWEEGGAPTHFAPQWVQLSSPDLTAGSRNLELDLADGSPIKSKEKNKNKKLTLHVKWRHVLNPQYLSVILKMGHISSSDLRRKFIDFLQSHAGCLATSEWQQHLRKSLHSTCCFYNSVLAQNTKTRYNVLIGELYRCQ